MIYVNPDHKTKEIIGYIDDLIVNGNVESFSDLTNKDKCILSGMILKTEPLTEILNFISQNDNDEKFRDVLSTLLMSPGEKETYDFCGSTAEFAIDYYEPMIESILNERLDELATF